VDTEPTRLLLAEGEGSGPFRSLPAHGVEPVKFGVPGKLRCAGEILDVVDAGDGTSAVGYKGWVTSGMYGAGKSHSVATEGVLDLDVPLTASEPCAESLDDLAVDQPARDDPVPEPSKDADPLPDFPVTAAALGMRAGMLTPPRQPGV